MPSSDRRVLVTNWHVFNADRSSRRCQREGRQAGFPSGEGNHHHRSEDDGRTGTRYLSLDDFNRQVSAGLLSVIAAQRDKEDHLKRVTIESMRYIESDTALVNRVLSQDVGGKQNILVMNDEAHHAYRIQRDEPDIDEEDEIGEKDEAEEFVKEATVWVEGLDHRQESRHQFCVDLSATPFISRAGQDTIAVPMGRHRFGLVKLSSRGW